MLPEPIVMGALIDAAAGRWPDKPAIKDENDTSWNFAALRDEARAVSRALIAHGIAAGDRIAIWAPNDPRWIFVAAGAEQIGVVVVPLNTRFKGSEAADVIRRSDARQLFVLNGFLGLDFKAMLADADLPRLDRIVDLDTDFADWRAAGDAMPDDALAAPIAAVQPASIADILFTSGTTGRSKGAMSSHMQNLRSFDAWSDAMGLEAGDRYLIVNPFFHSFGYKAGWLACLLRGATAYPVASFDAEAVLRRVAAERITVLPGPPTIFQSLLDVPGRDAFDLSSLRLAVTGAASVPPVLIHRMHDDLGIDTVRTAYGLTEACGVVTVTGPGDPPELIAESCGKPLPGVEVRVVDGAGREVADGEPGELLVRGFNVMPGYLDDPEETAKAIDADGWLKTGDIGTRDAQGYFRITDRAKDMFICGGFNVYPAEVEARLLDHPAVARAAVIGRPDPRLGEVAHAVVVAKPGAETDSAAFLAWCRAAMANYKAPRSVEWVDALPVNASGKVQRFLLRAPD